MDCHLCLELLFESSLCLGGNVMGSFNIHLGMKPEMSRNFNVVTVIMDMEMVNALEGWVDGADSIKNLLLLMLAE